MALQEVVPLHFRILELPVFVIACTVFCVVYLVHSQASVALLERSLQLSAPFRSSDELWEAEANAAHASHAWKPVFRIQPLRASSSLQLQLHSLSYLKKLGIEY